MTRRSALRSASLLALAAGTPAMAQFTINGRIDAAEQSLYQQKWVQTNPTTFGDNFSGAGNGASSVGNPEAVTRGIEIAIPYSALGNYAGGSIKIALMVNGSDGGFLSNQVLGSVPQNTFNLGDPRNVNFSVIGNAGSPPINQFWSGIPTNNAGPGSADIVIDGQLDTLAANNLPWGAIKSLQTNFTGFGKANHGNLITRTDNSQNNGSELDNLRVCKRNNTLYLFVGGNLEANFNKLAIFIDSNPNDGQNFLVSSNPGPLARLSDDGSGNGLTFDPDFSPDYFVQVNGGNTAADGQPANYQIFVNYVTMPASGGGQDIFCGSTTYGSNGVLSGGDAGAPAIRATVDNSNTIGVVGTPVGPSPNSAPNVDFAYGSELDALYSYVDLPNHKLHLLLAGNLQTSYNKVDLFFDVAPGGQNQLRGQSQEIIVDAGIVRYSGNTGIDFNGLNNMGATLANLIIVDPSNPLSPRRPGDGLQFDAGFEADYWLGVTNGGNGAGGIDQYVNCAPLRTDGIARNAFTGSPTDFGSYDGGSKAFATSNPIPFAGDGSGGGYIPPSGFEPFNFDLQGRYAPRHLSEVITDLPAPTSNLIIGTIDNSNVDGVSGTAVGNPGAVTTGIELEIDLRELGWDGVSPIRVAGFVNGSAHDFVSNQVLGGLPTGAGAAGGYDDRSVGNPRAANFASIPGNQFVVLYDGNTPPSCPADYNQDGVLNADDIGDFITGYFNVPSDPATDFNADGVINADDLGDFITAYFNGC